ncbi:MAG: hypothetical protein HY647_01270 [Acidobacteria bacterium]|nr:hypothetical protein [Acidobacteriota bacterium]
MRHQFFRPTFESEVAVPQHETILPLLQAFCPEGIRIAEEKGQQIFGCGDFPDEIFSTGRQRRYPWSDRVVWQADGIIFGHFLSPTSEDAAVSGFGAESHPYLWGGTLLLTRESGVWKPAWYKPGVITRRCRRVSLATGRQILLCEETDGGNGHSFHFLYTVDLLKPTRAWESTVLVADNYDSMLNGGVQKQSIDRIVLQQTPAGETEVQVYAHHGGVKLGLEDREWLEREGWPSPGVREYRIDFRLVGDQFTVTPETAESGKLFGVK